MKELHEPPLCYEHLLINVALIILFTCRPSFGSLHIITSTKAPLKEFENPRAPVTVPADLQDV